MSNTILGINNCFAVKRWPEPHQWSRVMSDELSMNVLQFSLDLVDLSMSHQQLLHKASKIKETCRSVGIEIHSVFTGLSAYQSNLFFSHDASDREHWLSWYKKAAWFTSELECSILGGHVGAFTIEDFYDPDQKDSITESFLVNMKIFTDYAGEVGIKDFALECMPVHRELTATIDDAAVLLDKIRQAVSIPISFCLDTGHQCAWNNDSRNRNFASWYRRFQTSVSMIHLQQNDGCSDQHLPFRHSDPENGVIKADEILKLLSESSFPALFLEIIPAHEASDDQVLQDLKDSASYWQRAAHECFSGNCDRK